MQWYHYVIIVAGAIILVMLLIALMSGKKPVQQRKPTSQTKQPIERADKPVDDKKADSETLDPNRKAMKYHISQNKDKDHPNFKKWRVRKEGSNKTMKFFDTQKEAISYAEERANTAGSVIVIHKMDGTIRKQNYKKKV